VPQFWPLWLSLGLELVSWPNTRSTAPFVMSRLLSRLFVGPASLLSTLDCSLMINRQSLPSVGRRPNSLHYVSVVTAGYTLVPMLAYTWLSGSPASCSAVSSPHLLVPTPLQCTGVGIVAAWPRRLVIPCTSPWKRHWLHSSGSWCKCQIQTFYTQSWR